MNWKIVPEVIVPTLVIATILVFVAENYLLPGSGKLVILGTFFASYHLYNRIENWMYNFDLIAFLVLGLGFMLLAQVRFFPNDYDNYEKISFGMSYAVVTISFVVSIMLFFMYNNSQRKPSGATKDVQKSDDE